MNSAAELYANHPSNGMRGSDVAALGTFWSIMLVAMAVAVKRKCTL